MDSSHDEEQDTGSPADGPDDKPLCLVCGEPAWVNMSTRPMLPLWVCEDHLAPDYQLEMFVAVRNLRQALYDALLPAADRLVVGLTKAEWLLVRAAKWWVTR